MKFQAAWNEFGFIVDLNLKKQIKLLQGSILSYISKCFRLPEKTKTAFSGSLNIDLRLFIGFDIVDKFIEQIRHIVWARGRFGVSLKGERGAVG